LGLILLNLGHLLFNRKAYDTARRMYEEAFPHHQAALKANPAHPEYRRTFRNNRAGLAQALLELGDHGAVALAISQFLKSPVDPHVDPASDTYNAACCLARCVPLVEKDKQLPDSKRNELARVYADKALAALRQAIHFGFKDAAHMEKDQDLDPLRNRHDFKKLLMDLGTKAKP
jgi:hypothetical protein